MRCAYHGNPATGRVVFTYSDGLFESFTYFCADCRETTRKSYGSQQIAGQPATTVKVTRIENL